MIKYFYTDGIDKFGPFSKEELKSQKINRTTKVWYFGLNEWVQLDKVESLNDILIAIPPELKKINSSKETEYIEPNTFNLKNSFKFQNNPIKIKWFIWGAVALILLLFIWKLAINQSEVNLKEEVVSKSYSTDENFEEYINKYYRDLEYYGIYPTKPKDVIIKFSRLDQLNNTTHLHGISYGLNDDSKIEIYINPSSWLKFSKPMRYYLMYHELSHDILNLKDLEAIQDNEGKLMYPELSSYDNKNMDEFIESSHALFEEHSKK
jgi:hypothetical protein